MTPPLNDDSWNRRGISILWDADALNSLCSPQQVISLRRFLQLHAQGWPESKLPLVNDEALVVAGLEGCIDALPPAEAEEWLVSVVYAAMVSFQREVSDGGNEAALVFWLVDHDRLQYQTSENCYLWHCGTEYRGQQVPLGRCLFNGAQQDLRRIELTADKSRPDNSRSDKGAARWIGLFHPRIS